MPHPFAFKPHAEAEQYAKSLSNSIEGKNGGFSTEHLCRNLAVDSDRYTMV